MKYEKPESTTRHLKKTLKYRIDYYKATIFFKLLSHIQNHEYIH